MEEQPERESYALAQLKRSWALYSIANILFLTAGYWLLSEVWLAKYAAAWLVLPLLASIYQSGVLLRHLNQNRRSVEDALLPSLGWGNRLTLMRGVLVAGMMGFLFLPTPPGWLIWIPGVLYTISDICDFFDGYVARVTNHATKLGETLDMRFDGVGVLAASGLVVQYGQAPAWYLLIGSARYLFLLGMHIRTRMGRPNYPLPPRLSRRAFAALQMCFLAFILMPVFSPPGTHIAATLFGLPLLFGFARDWLYISGVLRSDQGTVSARASAILHWLPSALRMAAPAVAFGLGAIYINSSRFIDLPLVLQGLVAFHGLVLALLLLGVLPRITAVFGLVLLGFSQMFASLTSPQISLAVIYTLILYLGGGRLVLYAPEEVLFHRPAGRARGLKPGAGA